MTTTALSLIARSTSHTETVRHPWSAELAEELSLLSDDSAEHPGELELWGTDDDGAEWRVHLTGPRVSRTEDAWWAWHDQDASRWSQATGEAEERCRAWVAGETSDGPEAEQ